MPGQVVGRLRRRCGRSLRIAAEPQIDTAIQGRGSYDVTLKDGITSPYAHLREIDEIHELAVKTCPIVLGTGMPMLGPGFAVTEFGLDEVRLFKNGVFVRTYSRKG